MKLVPYDFPRQPDYKSTAFEKSTARWKPTVDRILFRNAKFAKGLQDAWVHYRAHAPQPRGRMWTPKVYLCLRARFYWPTLIRLLENSERLDLNWKFYMAPVGYERPDKVVFYFESARALPRFIKTVRTLLPKQGFHTLSHTASTSEMALEREGVLGLSVGIDPPLLNTSWRLYRCLCVAWADLNESYLERLPGGKRRWFQRMNLSMKHEGPHSLTPDARDVRYVQRFWEDIGAHLTST